MVDLPLWIVKDDGVNRLISPCGIQPLPLVSFAKKYHQAFSMNGPSSCGVMKNRLRLEEFSYWELSAGHTAADGNAHVWHAAGLATRKFVFCWL